MSMKIHFMGLYYSACGLPITQDILLSGNSKRTTCKNCIRTAAHQKAKTPKKENFTNDIFDQPELFDLTK